MVKLASPAPWSSVEPGLPFGSTRPPYGETRRHGGKDYKWRYADPYRSRQVVAPVSGRVKAAFNDGKYRDGWGNHVDIQWGDDPGDFVRLAHFETGSVRVKRGDRVTAGQMLALMGATGDTNGQTHLHEELWLGGVRVDPDLYRGPDGRHLPGTETPAGGDAKPLPTPDPVIPEEEEEPMLTIVVGPKGNPAAAKYIYDQETGKLVRPVNGAAESAVLRAVETARPDACVFVEVDAKHITALKG